MIRTWLGLILAEELRFYMNMFGSLESETVFVIDFLFENMSYQVLTI